MNFCRLISLLFTALLAVAEPILAAQWTPPFDNNSRRKQGRQA